MSDSFMLWLHDMHKKPDCCLIITLRMQWNYNIRVPAVQGRQAPDQF